MAAISANEKPQKNFRSTTSASAGIDARPARRARRRCASAPSLVDGASATVGVERRDLELRRRASARWRLRTWSMISAAHHPRRVGHEARRGRGTRALALRHVEVGLVQQRRRAHADRGGALPRQFARGQTTELRIEHVEEGVGRGAASPSAADTIRTETSAVDAGLRASFWVPWSLRRDEGTLSLNTIVFKASGPRDG